MNMTAEVTHSGSGPGAHRSPSVPTRLVDRSALRTDELQVEGQHSERLFTHPSAKVFSFKMPNLAGMPLSPSAAWRMFEEDPSRAGTLPWNLPTEKLHAFGEMRIENKQTALFMKIGSWEKLLTYKTKCWCVDAQSKFAMLVRDSIYRFELPFGNEEDERKVEELKTVLSNILLYDKTVCPFRREFTVDVSEFTTISPSRNRFVHTTGPPLTPQYHRRSTSASLDGVRDERPPPSSPSGRYSSDEEAAPVSPKIDGFSIHREAFEAASINKVRATGPQARDSLRSVTAPSKLLPPTPLLSENRIEDSTNSETVLSTDGSPAMNIQQALNSPIPAIGDVATTTQQENIPPHSSGADLSCSIQEDSLSLSSTNDRLTPTTEDDIASVGDFSRKVSSEINADFTAQSSERNLSALETSEVDDLGSVHTTQVESETKQYRQPDSVSSNSSNNLATQAFSPRAVRQRPLTPQLSRRRSITPMSMTTTRRREERNFFSSLIFTIYAILMAPPSNLLTILTQLAAKIVNRILNINEPSTASGMPSDGPTPSPKSKSSLPGGWDDSDEERSSAVGGEDDDDEDDYGVPVGNKTPQRMRRRRLGSGDAEDVD